MHGTGCGTSMKYCPLFQEQSRLGHQAPSQASGAERLLQPRVFHLCHTCQRWSSLITRTSHCHYIYHLTYVCYHSFHSITNPKCMWVIFINLSLPVAIGYSHHNYFLMFMLQAIYLDCVVCVLGKLLFVLLGCYHCSYVLSIIVQSHLFPCPQPCIASLIIHCRFLSNRESIAGKFSSLTG